MISDDYRVGDYLKPWHLFRWVS